MASESTTVDTAAQQRETVPGVIVPGAPRRVARAGFLAGGATAAALATLVPYTAGIVRAADGPHDLALNVSYDGRTFRFDNGVAGPPARGASFIVNGKLFPAGTFATGTTNPDSPGSIGTWVCRGHLYYSLEEAMAGAAPYAASTQYYLFDDGSILVSEGLEGGIWTVRPVIGGAGRYVGAKGFCTEQEVATNNTMIRLAQGVDVPAPNLEFHFRLT